MKPRGETTAVPTGRVQQLPDAVDDAEDGLGPEEIVERLNTDELPVRLASYRPRSPSAATDAEHDRGKPQTAGVSPG